MPSTVTESSLVLGPRALPLPMQSDMGALPHLTPVNSPEFLLGWVQHTLSFFKRQFRSHTESEKPQLPSSA